MIEPLLILAPAPADLCSGRFGRMLDHLMDFGFDLAERLQRTAMLVFANPGANPAVTPAGTPAGTPSGDPCAPFLRAARASLWLAAFANVFTGLYVLPLRRARRVPAGPAATPTTMPTVRATPSAPTPGRPLGEDRWMRTVFTTRPIGRIVAGLCRDLGITQTSPLWPTDFVAITETLPAWAARSLPAPPRAIGPGRTRGRSVPQARPIHQFRAGRSDAAPLGSADRPIPSRPVRSG